MIEIEQSDTYRKWESKLKGQRVHALITARINRLAEGMPGDVKPIGQGLSELRIHFGAGYRVYFMQRGNVLIVLLCGGDKGSQSRDIEKAKQIAKDWEI